MKIEFQDRIDEYLLNRMSDEERLAFEQEVKNNQEFQEQLSFTEDVQQILKSRNEMLAKMEEWKDDYQWHDEYNENAANVSRATGNRCDDRPTLSQTSTGSQRRMYYWISGLAAVFIIGIFLFNYHKHNRYEMLGKSNLPTEEIYPTRENNSFNGLGGSQTDKPRLAQHDIDVVLHSIQQQEIFIYNKMVILNHELMSRGTEQDDINDELSNLQMQLDSLYWVKAQLLITFHRHDEAIVLLDKIRHSKNKYKDQADSLYNDIQTRQTHKVVSHD